MNQTKTIVLALAALAAAGATRAQSNSTSNSRTSIADNPGVLGQSFADIGLSLEDLRHTSDNAYDATLRGNAPVSPNLDVGFGYDYHWLDGNTNVHSHELDADARFYVPMQNHMKPFVGGLVGYQWARTSFDNAFPPVTLHDHQWTWGASAGVEIPVGTVALTPRIGYLDTMRNNSVGHYAYGIEANHWFTETVGGYADVSYNELRHQANTWTYMAGMRWRY